jgi:hypothetical protein
LLNTSTLFLVMIHFVALFKLKPKVSDEVLDQMIRDSRSQLLRITAAFNIRSGKRVDKKCEWPFFLAIDFESIEHLQMFKDDPQMLKFQHDVIEPNTRETLEMVYEMEPGKDTKYS